MFKSKKVKQLERDIEHLEKCLNAKMDGELQSGEACSACKFGVQLPGKAFEINPKYICTLNPPCKYFEKRDIGKN